MDNSKTITYQIKEEGFKYNMKEGRLLKGSTISKDVHPFQEVNSLKEKLINEKKIVDEKNYKLKDNIKTGMMMVYNLHHGKIKKELDGDDNSIVINSKGDKEIYQAFEIKNINRTDDEFINRLCKDEIKLLGIYEYQINNKFFLGNNPDDYSPTEELVSKILENNKIIKNYRHGIADNKEADIVIEEENRQIEIVFEYKNKIKKRGKIDNDPLIIFELVDSNLIHPSDSIIKKFYTKEYTSKYKKELAIFCIGDSNSIGTMLKQLPEYIENNSNIKNDYKKIYIIGYNFDKDNIIFYNGNEYKLLKGSDYDLRILNKRKIKFEELNNSDKYYIEMINIFNNHKIISILDGRTFKKFAKNINLII